MTGEAWVPSVKHSGKSDTTKVTGEAWGPHPMECMLGHSTHEPTGKSGIPYIPGDFLQGVGDMSEAT